MIPTNHFEWFVQWDCGSWVNDNGGIYHYDGNEITCVFENNNGIFYSAFASDGTHYATEPYGTVYAGKDGTFSVFAEGLFTQLKNISFSSDGDTMYVTTFGGGTYRMDIPAPETEAECTHTPQLLNEKEPTCTADGYTGDTYCADCGEKISEGTAIGATGHTWDDGVITAEPTETAAGCKVYTCSVCSETKTEEIYYEKELKIPEVSLSLSKNSTGKIVITGKVEDYENLEDYCEITAHGLLYIQNSRIGTRVLTLNTSGRTKVNCSKYAEDGSFTYSMKPSNKNTTFAFRAFVTYTDPETGKPVTEYSDMIRTAYNKISN